MDAAVPKQGAGELNQAKVVEVVLVVTYENRAALGEPTERAFDDPPPRFVFVSAAADRLFFANFSDVWRVAVFRCRLSSRGVVVPFIQAKVLGILLGGFGAVHDDRFDGLVQQFRIVDVRTVNHCSERTTVFLDDHATFRTRLAAICGISARFFPPKRALAMAPSAACHVQLTPPRSSHSTTRAAHIFSITPSLHHRWNQQCTVLSSPNRLGSWFHWQPERMRKMIPLTICRQSAVLRPVAFAGQYSFKIGSIRSHNSSGISQITPSPLAAAYAFHVV